MDFEAAQQTSSISGIGLSPLKHSPYFISHHNLVWGPGVSNTHHGYFLSFPVSLTTVVYSDIVAEKEYLLKETKNTAHKDFKLASMYPLPLKINPLQNLSALSPKPQNHLIYARMLTEEVRVNK